MLPLSGIIAAYNATTGWNYYKKILFGSRLATHVESYHPILQLSSALPWGFSGFFLAVCFAFKAQKTLY